MYNYAIIDLETTYGQDYGRVSNQLIHTNNVVTCGILLGKSQTEYSDVVISEHIPLHLFENQIIVAHNSKFELLWLLRYHYDATLKWIKRGGMLWCTQFTEYMLSGKVNKYAKLDELAPKYGGTRKIDKIKQYWEAGIRTEDIPRVELDAYLHGDVTNTHKVFLGQYQRVTKNNMLKKLNGHFSYMLFTGLCEWYGMELDVPKLDLIAMDTQNEAEVIEAELNRTVKGMLGEEAYANFSYSKNHHVSAILYGGTIKYQKRNQVGVYKSGAKIGLPRYSIEKCSVPVKGIGLELNDKTETSVPGIGVTNTKALTWHQHIPFVKSLIHWRHLDQLLKTFLDPAGNGVRGLVHPDSRIHGYLGHCGTATGRLNSSKPNLQNIDKRSAIKTAFKSRYGEKGLIVELDWSGLENSTTAHVSNDENLLKDLWDGVDLHSKRAAMMNDIEYSLFMEELNKGNKLYKEMRNKAKAPSFAFAYGAGKKLLMETTGLPEKDIKNFISINQRLYPETISHYEYLFEDCTRQAVKTKRTTGEGNPIYSTWFTSELGWPCVIDSTDSPLWVLQSEATRKLGRAHPYTVRLKQLKNEKSREGIYPIPDEAHAAGMVFTSFTNTVFKNYPNQNLASEIVSFFSKLLLTDLMPSIILDKVVPINTIHDSYIFDCQETFYHELQDIVKTCEERFPQHLEQEYGLKFRAPLRLEIKSGITWKTEED